MTADKTNQSAQLPPLRVEAKLLDGLMDIAKAEGRTLSDVAKCILREGARELGQPNSAALAVIEAELNSALMQPSVDLGRVETMARAMPAGCAGRARVMARAIQFGPVVPGGKDESYLNAVRLLHLIGFPVPTDAAWLAYAEHLSSHEIHTRAEAMAHLAVSLGGGGQEKLFAASKKYQPKLKPSPFWHSISSRS